MSHNPSQVPPTTGKLPGLPDIDVREHGGKKDGVPQVLDKRLFMQLLVLRCPPTESVPAIRDALGQALKQRRVGAVIYEDANDPWGIGVLSWGEDPAVFIDGVRPAFAEAPLRSLVLRPEMTMLGRTYSSGHEPNLAWWLLERPVENVLEEKNRWAVWYPLRRSGAFAKLEPHDQSIILREHAAIGMAYGQQDLAHDIRLACHGLDQNDNEFVIGLVGNNLHPLSHIVQSMRKTKQTSEFIVQMGPFFVGRAVWRNAAR
jgi:chlorite dismutase